MFCGAGGNLYGMGSNAYGQLGTNGTTGQVVPTVIGVDIWASGSVTAADAGQSHTAVVAGVCLGGMDGVALVRCCWDLLGLPMLCHLPAGPCFCDDGT